MANHASAVKRMRQNEKRKLRNKAIRSRINTLAKKVLTTKEKENAEVYLKEAVSLLDKAAVKKRIHKNNASRKKAKLTKYVNNL